MTNSAMPEDMLGRDMFLRQVAQRAASDGRIKALWLEGSLGRGNADRYSDVDLHVLVSAEDLPAFKQTAPAWMAEVEQQVLVKSLFGGAMLNGMTAQGLRWDLWPHAGASAELQQDRVLVLHEQPGSIRWVTAPAAPPSGPALLELMREFWRCISLLPAVLGRGEKIVAMQGLMVEIGLISELLMLSGGKARDRGVKNLNSYLPQHDRTRLEQALLLESLSLQDLADAHLRLAAWVQQDGPGWADMQGVEYPHELETVVLRVLRSELAQLDLQPTEL